MAAIFQLLALVVTIYYWLVIARVLLSWFPVDWYQQPYRAIRDATDPYLNAFRFIPPAGMFDFSPIVALLVLWMVRAMLVQMAYAVR